MIADGWWVMGVAGNGGGNIPTATRLTLEVNPRYTPHSANTDTWVDNNIYP